MGVSSLPKTVTRQRRGCDLNPGISAPESSTLTTRLPSHPYMNKVVVDIRLRALSSAALLSNQCCPPSSHFEGTLFRVASSRFGNFARKPTLHTCTCGQTATIITILRFLSVGGIKIRSQYIKRFVYQVPA